MSIARHLGLAVPAAVWFLATCSLPGTAHAQGGDKPPTKAERAAARDAYDSGTSSFEHGDFATALDSFVKANALIPSVQAMYWIAQSQDKLGRTDAAIEAYEAVTSRADFGKLSPDKAAIVHERLAALKAQTASPPATPPAPPVASAPVEQPTVPASTEPAAPPVVEVTEPPPPPSDAASDLVPRRNTAELGILGGLLFVSDSHNLVERGHTQRPFSSPVGQLGLRAAFFPHEAVGVEAEWAHGFGQESHVADAPRSSANFDALRGHLIGQLPGARVVPFALLGAGLLHGSSHQNGSDTDLLLEAGVGVKVIATELLVPRFDFRLDASQKKGGGLGDGIALHPEVLLGLGFLLGR